MAKSGPLDFHLAPFCWRIGTPILARLLPLPTEQAFLAIAVLGIWATGVGLYAAARAAGFEPAAGAFATLLFFSMGWASRFPLFDFWLPDAMAGAFLAWSFWAALAGRPICLAILLAAGVVFKESVLFVAPLSLTLARPMPRRAGAIARALAICLPAAAILICLRTAIPARNSEPAYLASLPASLRPVDQNDSGYDYVSRLTTIGRNRWQDRSLQALHSYWTGAFGIAATALMLIGLWRDFGLFVRLLPFLLCVYAQLLFATDTQRLLAAGTSAVILLTLHGLEGLAAWSRARRMDFVALPALLLLLNLRDQDRMTAPVLVQAAVAGMYIAGITIRSRFAARAHPA